MKMNEKEFRKLILSHNGTLYSPTLPKGYLAGEYDDLILVLEVRTGWVTAFLRTELDALHQAVEKAMIGPPEVPIEDILRDAVNRGE